MTPPPAWIRVLPPQEGVCRLCRGWSGDFDRCWQCKDFFSAAALPHVVLPLSLAVKGQSAAIALAAYKGFQGGTPDAVAFDRVSRFADVMLTGHETCVADAARVDRAFDVVTYLPGTHARPHPEPLLRLLQGVASIRPRLVRAVELTHGAGRQRTLDPDLVAVVEDVRGATVLVVDDTLTTGSSVLSAAMALRKAGAARVAIVTLGRHFVPSYKQCAVYLEEAQAQAFDPDWCALCDPRVSQRSLRAIAAFQR